MRNDIDENEALTDEDLEQDGPASEQAEALDLSTEERKLVTQPYDLGVKSLNSDIENGRIRLSIEYQRRYVWDSAKASRLIESLLLNVPIPVCYFAEDESGAYEVIDGLQRLTAIRKFLNNDFPLAGLSVLSELDNKHYRDLAPRDQRRLENRTIRCVVITEDSHPDIKFDVFERLNTGAATLTAQELRNSVYRGPLNDALKRIANESYLTDLLGSSSNRRMDFEELALRFFALRLDLERYRPPLRQFLNRYMRAHRQNVPEPDEEAILRDSCEAVSEVFGPVPFRLPGSKNNVNKALFDAIMVPVSFCDRALLRTRAAEAREALAQVLTDERFLTAVGRATADRARMLYRIGLVADKLRSAGIPISLTERLGLDEPEVDSDQGSF